jgi:hypothetical protein
MLFNLFYITVYFKDENVDVGNIWDASNCHKRFAIKEDHIL